MADDSLEVDDCCRVAPHTAPSAPLPEEFERFNCSICLELVYKPIVQGCGHIFCFWCVYQAMNFQKESHCPVCRRPYMYFPRVCEVLHFVLAKALPEEYKRRGHEVQSVEEERQVFSPRFVESPRQLWSPQNTDDVTGDNTQMIPCWQDDTSGVSVPESKPPASHNDATESVPLDESKSIKRVQGATNTKDNKLTEDDFCCALCTSFLFRPVVLNCGEVFCESCLKMASSIFVHCPSCKAPHSGASISICFELHQFLESKFPTEYSGRKEAVKIQEYDENIESDGSNSADVTDSMTERHLHVGVGCDGCGMFPIVGDRYHCEECMEKIGFDLCGNCYKNGGSVLGRFNQQHQPNHRMVQAMQDIIYFDINTATIQIRRQYEQITD